MKAGPYATKLTWVPLCPPTYAHRKREEVHIAFDPVKGRRGAGIPVVAAGAAYGELLGLHQGRFRSEEHRSSTCVVANGMDPIMEHLVGVLKALSGWCSR